MKHFDIWGYTVLRKVHGCQFNCLLCKTILNSRGVGGVLPLFLRAARHLVLVHGARVRGRGFKSKVFLSGE